MDRRLGVVALCAGLLLGGMGCRSLSRVAIPPPLAPRDPPAEALVAHLVGAAMEARGDLVGAREQYGRALRLDPDATAIQAALGRVSTPPR